MSRKAALMLGAAAAVLILAFLFFGGGPSPSDLRNWPGRSGHVVVFGDSLVHGTGAGPGEDFPSVMGRVLGVEVVNAGRPGDTTGDLLGRIDQVLEGGPRLVVLAAGGNDLLRQEDRDKIERNLEEAVRRLQEGGALVAVVGYRFGPGRWDLRKQARRAAESNDAWYVDNPMKGLFSDRKYKSDQIHLNAAGYEILGERTAEAVRPLLEGGR